MPENRVLIRAIRQLRDEVQVKKPRDAPWGARDTALSAPILRLPLSSSTAIQYPKTHAGLTAALGDAESGDVIFVYPSLLVGDVIVPEEVSLIGLGPQTVIDGQVTVRGILQNYYILRSGDQAEALIGLVSPEEGVTGVIKNVMVAIDNAGGPAYSISMLAGGNLEAYNTTLLAEVGSDGYAAFIGSGTLYHFSGRAVGTTAGYPYWIEE